MAAIYDSGMLTVVGIIASNIFGKLYLHITHKNACDVRVSSKESTSLGCN
jgi:hypothetical protein